MSLAGCAGTYASALDGIYREDSFESHGLLVLRDDGTFEARLLDKTHERASIGDRCAESMTEGHGHWRADAGSVVLTWDGVRQQADNLATTPHDKLAVGSVETAVWVADTANADWAAPFILSCNEHRSVNGCLAPCDGATLVWQHRSFVRLASPHKQQDGGTKGACAEAHASAARL